MSFDVSSPEHFPYELTTAIDGLNNEHRQKILFALKDESRLSFSEISERIRISQPLLANHLKKLMKTLLVEHFYEHKIGDEKFSFYRISPFGKLLLENMLETLYLKRVSKAEITYFKLKYEKRTSVPSSLLDLTKKTQLSQASSEDGNLETQVVEA